MRTDVLVIGGGPAGSSAAFQLASAGVATTLIDRA
ncbi:MAG: FAD-dependent oxidoreductase, partial [Vicinamibacteria bacterium]|nr:FAD-dependent oxidoreductase [Vicinamibacteria bacterium]